VVFGVLALACFVGAAASVVSGEPIGMAAGAAVFGLFWVGLSALGLRIGVPGLRRSDRERRLRATGLRGTATVMELRRRGEQELAETPYDLALRVELGERPPTMVSVSEEVPVGSNVAQGVALPVLVDPNDPNDLMVDWWSI
jgi:hypothetical protein